MTGPYIWMPEETAQARALRAEGVSYAKIATALRMTASQVYWHLVKRDQPRPRKLRLSPWRQNPALHDMMRALLNEGHSTTEVGRRIGMTKNAIIGRCHRTGLCKERYAGPTAMERMQALHDRQNELNAQSAAIPGIPVAKKSLVRPLGDRQGDGFGVRALGRGQNGFRALAPSSAKLR